MREACRSRVSLLAEISRDFGVDPVTRSGDTEGGSGGVEAVRALYRPLYGVYTRTG